MNQLSLTIEIREVSGDRCDEILGHILATAFPEATATVLSRFADEVDITGLGSLPQTTRGWVTTRYEVTATESPDLSAEAISAYSRVQRL